MLMKWMEKNKSVLGVGTEKRVRTSASPGREGWIRR